MVSQRTTPTFTTMLFALFTLASTALAASNHSSSSNQTMIDGPLFDKYQFLSPGLMMGFVVVFILLSILYVGVAALSSLEVTYGAFEKESGPGTAKKQQ